MSEYRGDKKPLSKQRWWELEKNFPDLLLSTIIDIAAAFKVDLQITIDPRSVDFLIPEPRKHNTAGQLYKAQDEIIDNMKGHNSDGI